MSNLKTHQQIDPAVEEVLASIRQIMAADGEEIDEKPQSDILSFPRRGHNSRQPLSENSDILTLTEFAEAEEALTPPRNEEVVMAAKNEKETMNTNAQEEKAGDANKDSSPLDLTDAAADDLGLKPENIEAPTISEESDVEAKLVSAEDIESLMSPEAVAQSAAAFNDLNKLNSEMKDKIQSGTFGHQTVDELMRELLKPLLKEWLDSHLPSLVKWLVAEKIEQMIREKQTSKKG